MSYYQAPPPGNADAMFWFFIAFCVLSAFMGWTVETPA